MKMKTHKAFSLVELVIVIAIIGVLTLLLLPQFQRVSEEAKVNTFKANCRTAGLAIGTYQAGHNGEMPHSKTEIGTYITGGWSSIENSPRGAHYDWDGQIFTAMYTDFYGNVYSFIYPD